MPRFASGASRCSISLSEKNKSSMGVDYTVPVLTITEGKDTRKQEFPKGNEVALPAFHGEVMKRLAAGWRLLIDDIPVEPQPAARYTMVPELEQAVEADPANAAAWAALGEAWTKAGDPRGDCIRVASTNGGGTDPAAFMRQKAAAEPVWRVRNGGFFAPFDADAYRVNAKFAHGLVDTIELTEEGYAPGRAGHQLLELALTNPFARFLTKLTIGVADVAPIIDVIANAGAPALRALVLDQHMPRSQTPVRIGRLGERLSRLRRLVLHLDHAPIDWAGSRFNALTELEIEEPGSPAQCEEWFAWGASQPTLEKLTIGWGLSGSLTGAIHKLLTDWATDQSRWPASLRTITWQGRSFTRST
ncbi:MAG: hypothetical protein R3B48_04615 [Kofleriaceae bacterium]